jgi:hypothetical protein
MDKLRHWFGRQYRELDLLPEYFGVVASRWQALLWGGSALAIGWGLRFIVSEWRPWVNWTAVLVASFFAGYYAWESDRRRLTPGLYIEPTPNLQETPITHTNDLGHTFLTDHRTFVQIVPRCKSDAPAHECRGYLKEFRRWCPVAEAWETMDLKSLQLRWDNSEDEDITLHPGVEKPLNIIFIQRHNWQVFPCVFADISIARVVDTFKRRPGAVEAYEFDIYVVSSERRSGDSLSTLSAKATVRVQVDNPRKPYVEVVPEGSPLTQWLPHQR